VIKAKFHYASWFGAGSKLVRSWFEFEPDSVMEFDFYKAAPTIMTQNPKHREVSVAYATAKLFQYAVFYISKWDVMSGDNILAANEFSSYIIARTLAPHIVQSRRDKPEFALSLSVLSYLVLDA